MDDPYNFEESEIGISQLTELTLEDQLDIKTILSQWIINWEGVITEEVEEDLQIIRDAVEGKNNRTYWVIRDYNNIVGIIGLRPLHTPGEDWRDDAQREFAQTDNPVGMANFYIARQYRGKGLGTLLMKKLIDNARALGYTELLVRSGPRYSNTGGWNFYTKNFEYAGEIPNYFGDRSAQIWRYDFSNSAF
jgi:GNAT superfamily N-acetyltransferase